MRKKQKPKKRKSHNINKRLVSTSRAVVKKFNWSFAFVGGQAPELWDIKNMTKVRPSETDINAMSKVAHQWSILISAICRDQDGNEYAKSTQITTSEPYLQSDLTEVLGEHHKQLLEECNPSHKVNAAWIARPDQIDWDENTAGGIYKMMGAWDTLSKQEALQLEKDCA